MHEDWNRGLTQFKCLFDEYDTAIPIRLRYFGHSLQHKSHAYHYYQTIWKYPITTWPSVCTKIAERYHSERKPTRLSRQLKALHFGQFRAKEESDDADLKNLLAKMENLSCLAHDIE